MTESPTTSKKAVAAGIGAGLLGGAAAGLLFFGVPGTTGAESPAALVQQEDPADTGTETETDTDDGTTDDVDRAVAVRERMRETLQPLVDEGTLTGAQADAVADHLIENRPERGHHGHHGRGGPGQGLGGEAVAETLGLEREELREALSDGGSLADVARDNGVEPQTLIDAIVAEAQSHLDEAVEEGRLTADEAAERSADLEERVTEMVERELPAAGERGDARRGPFGGEG